MFCSRWPQRRPRGVLLSVVLLPLLRRPQRRGDGQSLSLPPQSGAEPRKNTTLPADRLLHGLQKVGAARAKSTSICVHFAKRKQSTADWLLPCCSVGFCSVSSCVDDLDESRSLELKRLLAEYFDKRRDRSHVYAPQEVEELAKYKVGRSLILTHAVSVPPPPRSPHFPFFADVPLCFGAAVRLGGADQGRRQELPRHAE